MSKTVETENISNDISEVIDLENEAKDYSSISLEIDTLMKTLSDTHRSLKNLKKDLDKVHQRELKSVKKKKKGDPNNKSNKEPSGFNKPAIVPSEFCKQPWGCEEGQLIPRTQLTKMVYDYIKDNTLQDPNDKRIIHPDKNVKTLFHLEAGQVLEFKTFQTYMAKLYKKNVHEVEPVVDPVTEPVENKTEKKTTRKKGNKKSKDKEEVIV